MNKCARAFFGASIGVLCLLFAAIPSRAQLSMLHQSGLNIVDASNKIVQLRGIDLGDWLVMEPWMCPGVSVSDANGSFPDQHSILTTLDSRFGVSTEQSLINSYQSAYITSADLQNIRAQGLNVIRVPFWWGNFYTLGSGTGGTGSWRSDAFTRLDWVVSQAASLGIYTIIDMHGAIGQQSMDHSTGWQNQNNYWTNSADQQATNQLWAAIATHYAGNPNVAGYDILNEPDSAPSDSAVINAYAGIVNAIRAADPNHICFIEGTFDQWNWSMPPSPSSEGWTNVVYEMHQYNGSGAGNYSAAQGQVSDWQNHWAWDVPDYVGEFNPAQNATDSSTGLTWWQDVVDLYSANGISWSVWAYKAGGTATAGGNWNNNWGLYQPNPNLTIPTPSLATDSASTIQSDWAALTTSNDFVLNTNISNAVTGADPPAPSSPGSIPGTVEAENYDTGGPNAGYSVGAVNGSANSYRLDGIDIENCSDAGGGYDLGWTSSGQWFRYTVDVAKTGTYSVACRVSSGASGGTFHVEDVSGTNLSGSISVPATGGWQNWTTVDANLALPAGQQVLTVYQDTGGYNMNNLVFTLLGTPPPVPTGLTAAAGRGSV
jgi:hypothetical protein